VNHKILLAKLQHYGTKGANAELSNRKQRVEIKTNTAQSYLSNWDTVKHGVPQGSVLGPLLLLMYINDLPLQSNKISHPILFADDTSVLISKENYDDFQQTSNLVLSHMIKWFEANQLVLNMDKTNMLKFKTSNVPHQPLTTGYKQKYVKELTGIKFLGVRIDSCLTWKNQIEQVIPKLSAACYAVRMMYHIMNIDALRMIYFWYFDSVMEYGTIFWGNSASVDKVFKLQKRTVRIMAGVRSRCLNTGPFKRMDLACPVSTRIFADICCR
jgi:hypothetical protein